MSLNKKTESNSKHPQSVDVFDCDSNNDEEKNNTA